MSEKIILGRKKRRDLIWWLWSICRYILVFGLAFIILQPFFIKILNALMSPNDLLDPMVQLLPKHLSDYYFSVAWNGLQLSSSFFNSVMLTVTVAVFQTFSCTMIGYGLARFNFRGKNLAFFCVILIIIVSPQSIAVSQYLQFRQLHLIDTFFPSWILSILGLGLKNGLYIYLFRQFYKGMPKELENAAYVDGCAPIKAFFTIMLPNAMTIMSTVFIFSVCWQWTDIHYSTLFFSQKSLLPTMIQKIKIYLPASSQHDPTGTFIAQNAACLLILIPIIILFIIFQKSLVKGISRSGMAN